MEKEFLDFIPLDRIETRGIKRKHIGYKSFVGIFILLAFGVFAICIPNMVCRIMGILVLVLGVANIFLVKNKRVIDIYTEGLLVYKYNDDANGAFFDYKSIRGWSVKRNKGNGQTVLVLLDDRRFAMTETFSLIPVKRLLFKYMPGKEINS